VQSRFNANCQTRHQASVALDLDGIQREPSCRMGCNVVATFPIYPAHTAVVGMDCQTGIVAIYTKDDKDAFRSAGGRKSLLLANESDLDTLLLLD
jgi:hypothetical protein